MRWKGARDEREIVRRDPAAAATPQARHPFTRFDQVDQLTAALAHES